MTDKVLIGTVVIVMLVGMAIYILMSLWINWPA